MNRLLLIDGNALMHRAYHALPPMRSEDGRSVHVVYGFISVLIRLFQDIKPTHIAVAFDRPGPTFREKLFKEYQQQRPKMDDDFISQLILVHEVVHNFGISVFELDGFEADDMIGTISAAHFDGQVVIVTGDRDILQLVVDDKVLVFMPTKGISEGKIYGEKDVEERMGVPPKLIADFKALAGDPSDNYPGVVGVGPKSAVNLLTKYGSLENIYTHINKVTPEKLQEKLKLGKESAILGITLSTIRKDAPIDIDFEKMKMTSLNTPKIIAEIETFPFPSLIKRIQGTNQPAVAQKGSAEVKQEKSKQQELF